MQTLVSSRGVADKVPDVVGVRDGRLRTGRETFSRGFLPGLPPGGPEYLNGGDKSCGDVGAQQGGHVQLPHVLLLSESTGDALLAQELKTGHPVLHADHVERWPTSQEEARVSVAPADGSNGPLKDTTRCVLCERHL